MAFNNIRICEIYKEKDVFLFRPVPQVLEFLENLVEHSLTLVLVSAQANLLEWQTRFLVLYLLWDKQHDPELPSALSRKWEHDGPAYFIKKLMTLHFLLVLAQLS